MAVAFVQEFQIQGGDRSTTNYDTVAERLNVAEPPEGSIVHTAGRTPSAIFAVGFGFLMLEFAFALVTAAVSSGRLGELAWVRVFGGSVIGAVIAIFIVTRRHPLLALLHQAEEET